MIKIRALRSKELRQVLSLLDAQAQSVPENLAKLRHFYIPIHWFSQLLPPHWQFVPAMYVAAARDQVLGLIGLSQDGEKASRWLIDEIIIDPEVSTYDIGTQLVNFVINRYGAGGVQTFLARVLNDDTQTLGLLKSCGFRHCARVHVFHHERPVDIPGLNNSSKHFLPKGFRQACREDAEKLQLLYSEAIPAETRLSMEKPRADFSMSFSKMCKERMNGVIKKRWVVEDVARDLLVSSLELTTQNYKDFTLSLMVSPGWQEQFEDLLHFGLSQALTTTKSAQVSLEVFDFHKEQVALLEKLGFTRHNVAEILVKDYWIPLQDKPDKRRSPLLIFEGGKASPAVNQV